MAVNDTSMGGSGRAFPTTVWSEILKAGDRSHPDCREQMEHLVRQYWKPVFAYVRTSWKKPVEDAKDLTQGFFVHLLDKDRLARLQPERGSFRGFLKRSVHNFVIDQQRADIARRPSSGPLFSLDATPGELDRLGPVSPDDTPDKVYDREWFRCLFHAAMEDLEKSLKKSGREKYYEVFRVYCLDPLEGKLAPDRKTPTYGEVGERFGLKETDVGNYLNYARATVREILRTRIREYVTSEDEVERELREAIEG
jgi:RNA polymerase sigma-70 factor (ECF subfamily)